MDGTYDARSVGLKVERVCKCLEDKDLDQMEDVWVELLADSEVPGEFVSTLVDVAERVIESGELDRGGALLELLLPVAQAGECPAEVQVRLSELLVRAVPRNSEYRQSLVDSFESLYGPTTPERAFFSVCGVLDSADPAAALDRFHRLRRFLPGACVYHAAGWGMGEVVGVDPFLKQVLVNLEEKKNHRVAIEVVDSILEPLEEDSFRALLYRGGEELRRLAAEEPVELTGKVLAAFGNPLALKEIRSRLVPDVIAPGEWNRWWNQTKRLLRESGYYRVTDKVPHTVERLASAVNYEEELLRGFRGSWSEARQVARSVIRGGARKFPKVFPLVSDELSRRAEESDDPTEAIEAAAILTRKTGDDASALGRVVKRFRPGEIVAAVEKLPGGDELSRVLKAVAEQRSDDWLDVVKLSLSARTDAVREASCVLLEEREPQAASDWAEECCRAPGRAPEAFCWLLERRLSGAGGVAAEPLRRRSTRDLLVLTLDLMAHVVDRGQRGVMSAGEIRSLMKRLESLLMRKDSRLFERGLREASGADHREVHSCLVRCAVQLPDVMSRPLEALAALYPEVVGGGPTRPWEEEGTIYATRGGLARKNEEYRQLKEEKLPQNFEAVGKAAEFGDLSENAEFTSALEEQAHLTKLAARIEDELKRARVLGPELVPEREVGLGSRIRVEDLDTREEMTYSVLGPWDGTPEEGVLNYHSPLGQGFLGRLEGDEVHIELPSGSKRFRILAVGSHFDH